MSPPELVHTPESGSLCLFVDTEIHKKSNKHKKKKKKKEFRNFIPSLQLALEPVVVYKSDWERLSQR